MCIIFATFAILSVSGNVKKSGEELLSSEYPHITQNNGFSNDEIPDKRVYSLMRLGKRESTRSVMLPRLGRYISEEEEEMLDSAPEEEKERAERAIRLLRLGKSIDKRVYKLMRLGKRDANKRVMQLMRLGK